MTIGGWGSRVVMRKRGRVLVPTATELAKGFGGKNEIRRTNSKVSDECEARFAFGISGEGIRCLIVCLFMLIDLRGGRVALAGGG